MPSKSQQDKQRVGEQDSEEGESDDCEDSKDGETEPVGRALKSKHKKLPYSEPSRAQKFTEESADQVKMRRPQIQAVMRSGRRSRSRQQATQSRRQAKSGPEARPDMSQLTNSLTKPNQQNMTKTLEHSQKRSEFKVQHESRDFALYSQSHVLVF